MACAGLDVGILVGHLMAANTVRFVSVDAPLDVLDCRYDVKMIRVYAAPIFAEVIDHQSFGYRSSKFLVGEPMRLDLLCADRKLAVTVLVG
jgi:hypothetical protein